jgi:hypothetical protein
MYFVPEKVDIEFFGENRSLSTSLDRRLSFWFDLRTWATAAERMLLAPGNDI